MLAAARKELLLERLRAEGRIVAKDLARSSASRRTASGGI